MSRYCILGRPQTRLLAWVALPLFLWSLIGLAVFVAVGCGSARTSIRGGQTDIGATETRSRLVLTPPPAPVPAQPSHVIRIRIVPEKSHANPANAPHSGGAPDAVRPHTLGGGPARKEHDPG